MTRSIRTSSDSASKPVNRMDRLQDMAHFPAAVHAGATANVLFTIFVTWWVQPRFPQPWAFLVWVLVVLGGNLLPVVLLRRTLAADSVYPRLAEMNFFRDQHKFSNWVYLAASANMAFWIVTTWVLFTVEHTAGALMLALAVAFFATFSPVLLRSRTSQRVSPHPPAFDGAEPTVSPASLAGNGNLTPSA